MIRVLTLLAATVCAASAPIALGGPVTWGSATNISGDSDVNTSGALVAAFDMVGNAATVNGVAFASFAVTSGTQTATSGNFTFTETPGQLRASSSGLSSASPPFSTLSASYQTLLGSAISTTDANTLTLTMSGLVVGQQYLFEWWVNRSGNYTLGGLDTTASSAAGNTVSLNDNTGPGSGGTQGSVGQYAVGMFTATGATQVISFNATDVSSAPSLNAFQLRAVPEPSTAVLLLVGASATVALMRRRKALI